MSELDVIVFLNEILSYYEYGKNQSYNKIKIVKL